MAVLWEYGSEQHDSKEVEEVHRRGKLQRLEEIEDPEAYEKRELVNILMVKCSKTKLEVLKNYEDFYKKNPNGSITKEEYVNSTEVTQWIVKMNTYLNSYRTFWKLKHSSVFLMRITAEL